VSHPTRSLSVQSAVLALLGVALLAGVLPAGLVLERWLARELEARARRDVDLAPAILADRNAAIGDALMMHAKDVAATRELGDALAAGDTERAQRLVRDAAGALNHGAVLTDRAGTPWEGPATPAALVQATQQGEMPVAVVADSAALYLVSVAAVVYAGRWLGAAGVANPLDTAAAEALAGLTRSDLVLVMGAAGAPVIASSAGPAAAAIARAVAAEAAPGAPREVRVGGTRYLVATAPLAGATVAFARDLRRELAILPRLRRVLLASGGVALAVALLLGALLARRLVRPVRGLASAAERLSRGEFDAPLEGTRLREVMRVGDAFAAMRTALAQRIDELRAANRMLEERQARLAALQSELIRRERVATSGRMAVELAHEIRNPVANVRNCLELLHRRLGGDAQGQEYASLAIDELLRMHELAERMLELYRPRGPADGHCDAAVVAREVAALAGLARDAGTASVTVGVAGRSIVEMPADAYKQVLLNLVENAKEARPRDLVLRIDVREQGASVWTTVTDNGPGIPPALRSRIFDPFFTTREATGGMGLGLFIVEGVVRSHGGRAWVTDGEAGSGTTVHIVLPAGGALAVAGAAADAGPEEGAA
jgi:signal transduction histidine kinase